MKKITNISTDRRPVLVQLDHQTFRRSVYGFRRQTVHQSVTTKEGTSSFAEQSRAIDGVLTLAWRESKAMHDDIAQCPSVQALVRAKRISIEDVPAPAPAPEAEPPKPSRKRNTESQG